MRPEAASLRGHAFTRIANMTDTVKEKESMKNAIAMFSFAAILAIAALAQPAFASKPIYCHNCCHDKCAQMCGPKGGCTESCCQSK